MTQLRLYVLLAIGKAPLHGYAIGKEIAERSEGRLDPSTGALYQALKRLADEGMVKAVDTPKDASTDLRRNYFEITAAGRRALSAELQRLESLVDFARRGRLLRGKRS